MVNWMHYLIELVGSLGTLRKIEVQIWDVVEAHKRAEQDEDDYLAQDALDVLRYDLLKIETRQKWAVAGCEEWKEKLLNIMATSTVTAVRAGPSATKW